MPWGKIDDQFHDHPKTLRAIELGGLAAIGLHMLAISYCNEKLTDGIVPSLWVGRRTKLADALVNAKVTPGEPGMWEIVEGGWQIHDFLHFNPSKASVLEKRAKDSTRKRVGIRGGVRKKSSMIPRKFHQPPVPVPVPSPTQMQVQATAFTFWGKSLLVTQADLTRWTAAYQPLDVLGELRRLEAWAAENRRDYHDVRRFVVNNLSRARARVPKPEVPPVKVRPEILDEPEPPPSMNIVEFLHQEATHASSG